LTSRFGFWAVIAVALVVQARGPADLSQKPESLLAVASMACAAASLVTAHRVGRGVLAVASGVFSLAVLPTNPALACAAGLFAVLVHVFHALIDEVLGEATLKRPADVPYSWHGKRGEHTEHLGYLLAEMQFLHRAYPGASW